MDKQETIEAMAYIIAPWLAEPHKAQDVAVVIAERLRVLAWQDISTAPKDGTRIIVYRPKADPNYIPHVGADYWDKTYFGGAWMKSREDTQPTHWMPFPEPPTFPQQ